jgi:serine/threonine protein kinase
VGPRCDPLRVRCLPCSAHVHFKLIRLFRFTGCFTACLRNLVPFFDISFVTKVHLRNRFNADTAEKVFENILSRRINWHEDAVEVSPEARDLMCRLLCNDPDQRLGSNGIEEVKRHPFFNGIDWATVRTGEASFVPQVADPESTDYFDTRGAIAQLFNDEEPAAVEVVRPHKTSPAQILSDPIASGKDRRSPRENSDTASRGSDDFGAFSFKNLDYFKQANDDVIRKMRNEMPLRIALDGGLPAQHARHIALGGRPQRKETRVRGDLTGLPLGISSNILRRLAFVGWPSSFTFDIHELDGVHAVTSQRARHTFQ